MPPASAVFKGLRLLTVLRSGGRGLGVSAEKRVSGRERGEARAGRYGGATPPGGALVAGTRRGCLAKRRGMLTAPPDAGSPPSGMLRAPARRRKGASPCRHLVPGWRSSAQSKSAGLATLWPEDDLGRTAQLSQSSQLPK